MTNKISTSGTVSEIGATYFQGPAPAVTGADLDGTKQTLVRENSDPNERIAIIGAGISGLSLAWLLSKRGKRVKVFEASPRIGGLARTFEWNGIPCDLAPHRLHTHDHAVLDAIRSLVPLHEFQRRSKILMREKQIQDPINPIELVMKLPLRTGLPLVWGFLTKPNLQEESFESVALNRYGRGLYDFFFEPYTRKMFGVSPREISVTWGREKLRASGLLDAIKRSSKTFFSSFWYPEQGGYGAIGEAMHAQMRGEVHLQAPVTGLSTKDGRITSVQYREGGEARRFECDRVFSTIPATYLARMFNAELNLRFRRIQLVYINARKPEVMPYHWVYFGDGDVVINRMAEFKHFHVNMPKTDNTVICAEVTVDTNRPIEDTMTALKRYGLLDESQVAEAMVLPEQFGYPVYDKGFEAAKEKANALFGRYQNLHLVGRNAEFRHIELDEDLGSAMECVDRIYGKASVAVAGA